MPTTPKAELISYTKDPLGTLYFIWQQSRAQVMPAIPNEAQKSIGAYENAIKYNAEPDKWTFAQRLGKEVIDTVKQLIFDDVPVTENIHFTFYLTGIPVSLREQLVRHRIGVSVGPEQGLDQIPELGSSSFWSQTSRMVSQGDFYASNRYIVPDSVVNSRVSGDESPYSIYDATLEDAQSAYSKLLLRGIPMEDARQVLPLAATQSITWTLSLKSLIHIVGKRACWIAQYGLWGNVIRDIVNELCDKIHPLFRSIIQPPCLEKGKFKSCPIEMINLDRLQGNDPYPPCPMWASHHENINPHLQSPIKWGIADGDLLTIDQDQVNQYKTMRDNFESLWKLDPETGEPITKK